MAVASAVVGIDVGATKVAAALFTPSTGAIDRWTFIATEPRRGGAAVLADCVALAAQAASGRAVGAVGVGVCELVDCEGAITSASSFDWRGLDVGAAFSEIAPVRVESDVRAAALAESVQGAGRGLHSFLYVNSGSGVSSALVLDGVPYPGSRGNAILMGAGPFNVERQASGTAIARQSGRVSAERLAGAAATGDAEASAVIRRAASALGEAIAFAVNLLDPEAVVLGGGLALGGGLYRQTLEQTLRAHIWADSTRTLEVRASPLGGKAGVIGAALVGAALVGGSGSTASIAVGRTQMRGAA